MLHELFPVPLEAIDLIFRRIAKGHVFLRHEEDLPDRHVMRTRNHLARLQHIPELALMRVPVGFHAYHKHRCDGPVDLVKHRDVHAVPSCGRLEVRSTPEGDRSGRRMNVFRDDEGSHDALCTRFINRRIRYQ